VEDPYVREFYLLLFNYIYDDQNDYTHNLGYLKRRIKINIIEKYEKYIDYLTQKEEAIKRIENLVKEKGFLLDEKNYIKNHYDTHIKIKENKERFMKHLANKIDDLEKELYLDE
jgi:hypothetical protein